MGHYLLNFSVYSIAMVGLIFLALFIFKICMGGNITKKSSMLNIIDSMKLSPRKTLYVIKVGDEKYLIAADIDSTSLIAKLESSENRIPLQQALVKNEIQNLRKDKTVQLRGFDEVNSVKDFSTFVNFKQKTNKQPVMKELVRKLKQG